MDLINIPLLLCVVMVLACIVFLMDVLDSLRNKNRKWETPTRKDAEEKELIRGWLIHFIVEGNLTTFTYEKQSWNESYVVCYEVLLQQKKDIRYVTISAYDMELWKKQKRLREELENKKRRG